MQSHGQYQAGGEGERRQAHVQRTKGHQCGRAEQRQCHDRERQQSPVGNPARHEQRDERRQAQGGEQAVGRAEAGGAGDDCEQDGGRGAQRQEPQPWTGWRQAPESLESVVKSR